MNHPALALSLTLLWSALPSKAAQVDLSKLPAPAQRANVRYAEDIRPIFERSCFNCHGERRQRGELRLDSLEAALKGGEDGAVIVPGKSQDSPLVIAVARLDEETAMPPPRRAGGGGGFGGGGLGRTVLSQRIVAQADTNQDQQASKAELGKLADNWYAKMDSNHTGKLDREQFGRGLGTALVSESGNTGSRGAQPAGYVVNGFFAAADKDKDGAMTREEFAAVFKEWSEQWGEGEDHLLTQEKLYAGLQQVMPQNTTGGGPGRPDRAGTNRPNNPPRREEAPGNRNDAGPGAGNGPPPTPLNAEQVALIRAWIDQGAK